jgi:DNA polymerase elongation subunit (family B)
MQAIAKKLGFKIIYGDTDSLFLNNVTSKKLLSKYQDICTKKLRVEQETKKQYYKLLLSAGAKHYIGIGVDDEGNDIFDVVGYEGKKNDRCEFFQNIFSNIIDCIFKTNANPIPCVVKAMSDLDAGKVAPNLLSKSIKLGQNPKDYRLQTCQPAKIGKALGAKQGELITFFNADIKKAGKSWSTNPKYIDTAWYKQHLWNTIYEPLEIAGYSALDLAKQFDVTTARRKNGHGVQNLLEV